MEWYPDNVSCRIKVDLPTKDISHTTIYSLIEQDKANGGIIYRNLQDLVSHSEKAENGRQDALSFLIEIDVSERSAIVEERLRLGDWGGTVYGKDAHLVTVVDRRSHLLLLGKVSSKHSEIVVNKIIEFLSRAPGAKTITLDNGGQFAMHGLVPKAVGADIHFAKPYASYQRGTNEITNGIILPPWPKKIELGHITEKEIKAM